MRPARHLFDKGALRERLKRLDEVLHKRNPCKPLKKREIRRLSKTPFFGVNFAKSMFGKVKISALARDLGESKK